MDFFRFEARPAIFSSAVLPHEVAGLGAALNVIQEEDWRRERLRHNSDSLRRRLAVLGFDVPLEGSKQMIFSARWFARRRPRATAPWYACRSIQD
jgi:CAI-1 autoinducer synthase